jgi:hypothetical protein
MGSDSDPALYFDSPVWHGLIISSILILAFLLAFLYTSLGYGIGMAYVVRLCGEVDITRLCHAVRREFCQT